MYAPISRWNGSNQAARKDTKRQNTSHVYNEQLKIQTRPETEYKTGKQCTQKLMKIPKIEGYTSITGTQNSRMDDFTTAKIVVGDIYFVAVCTNVEWFYEYKFNSVH